MWNNKKTGKFSRWIKLGLIEIDENDTSSIEGYRSKVSRGVDCRLVVHNPKNSKKMVIIREDTNLGVRRSISWWKKKVDGLTREVAHIKVLATNKSLMPISAQWYCYENNIYVIDTSKKLTDDEEMYDREWCQYIRSQCYFIYYRIKHFLGNIDKIKKNTFMCNSYVVDTNDYHDYDDNEEYNIQYKYNSGMKSPAKTWDEAFPDQNTTVATRISKAKYGTWKEFEDAKLY